MEKVAAAIENIRRNGAGDLYHKMIEEIQDYAILLLDREGNILNWNKGAEKIKGYSESEIIGKNFRIFYGESDRKNELPEQLISQATTQGKAMHEGWRLRKNGERFWGSIVITALHNEQNDVIGFTKVTRDLTEKKMTEDQLKQKAIELEFRNNELEQFAYVASHDLQEPLRKIQVFSSLLKKNVRNEEFSLGIIERINTSAQRMTNLVKDILQYAKLSTGEELLKPVDLNSVMANVLEDFELLLEERGARVTYTTLPVVMGIPVQLHQLLLNLLSNAIKFSQDSPIIAVDSEKVSSKQLADYEGIDRNKGYVKLIFTDNGTGFDPKYTDEAFKLFKRLKEGSTGTGIGLALCKKIVENHGGHISVTSKPNQGTTFYILLPVA